MQLNSLLTGTALATGLLLYGCSAPDTTTDNTMADSSATINTKPKVNAADSEVSYKKPYTKDYIGQAKSYYGASYYPETWDSTEVDKDIAHMKALNMNVMRMAEFSWSKMEPKQGQYDFDWLHQIIEKLHANGIDVILGTPTATPPIWLTEKHPDIWLTDHTGLKETHGARKSYNYASQTYRIEARRIAEKMAKEFGNKPGVIGWQTDNELSIRPDFSQETKERWTNWLRKRYNNDIDSLNELWATDLWSQTYERFDQIPMERPDIWHHPSLKMAWHRFNNQMIIDFQKIHIEAIARHSKLPITHDGMPSQAMDYESLFEELDFMSVNNYHSFEAYNRVVSNYDRMRGYNKGRHWLFETAPNNSGGGPKGETWFLHQPDGALFAAIWMNHALGGQGSLFWLFRQHRAGQEMVHGSIISAWGKPVANYNDLKELGSQLNKTSDFQINAPVAPAQVAVFYDNMSDAAFRIEQYANGIKYYNDWTYRFYVPILDSHIHRDVIPTGISEKDLSQYKVIFAPMMPYIPEELKAKLKAWTEAGGTLILGPMTGYRTKEFTAHTKNALGDLEDWTGISVESRIPTGTKIREAEIPLMLNFSNETGIKTAQSFLWSESLSSENGKVLATYNSGMHKNLPAIIENKVGKGKAMFLGADPGKKAIAALIKRAAAEHNILPIAKGDGGVVVAPRQGQDQKGYVVVNIENKPKQLTINGIAGGKDLITDKKITSNNLKLKPFQVMVIKL